MAVYAIFLFVVGKIDKQRRENEGKKKRKMGRERNGESVMGK